jgi:hypothetical protein
MDSITPDPLTEPYDTLSRYAGWLDRREPISLIVRADVKGLGIAIDARANPVPQLRVLESTLARLPRGGLQRILRVAAATMRRAIEDAQRGEGSS